MTFAAAVPFTGYAGWTFLKRTQAAQTAALAANPANARDEAYFREKIGTIRTAEALVDDRRLLRVALTAFGLESDVNNRFFIRKVLEDGTLNTDALANRLADSRYREFSAAFGFGDFSTPRTALSDFPDKILGTWRARQFEASVGETDQPLRLALNAARELPGLAAKGSSETSKWFSVMGNAPLRQVFEGALGLPSSFGVLDIDKQREVLEAKAEAAFGAATVSQFTDPEKVEALVRRYLARAGAESIATGPGTAALTILQSGQASLAAFRGR